MTSTTELFRVADVCGVGTSWSVDAELNDMGDLAYVVFVSSGPATHRQPETFATMTDALSFIGGRVDAEIADNM